ncbi:hypothetical protein FXW78_23385 [Rhodococcus opacus]|nr:hypothetical protein [Rhodococcus opacus]
MGRGDKDELDSKNLARLRRIADARPVWTSESGDFTPTPRLAESPSRRVARMMTGVAASAAHA